MSANFPSTPSIGDTVTIENIKYRWTGTTWIIVPGAVQSGVVQSNNGAIDLSKGSYHKILIDANNTDVTVSFSNVPSGSSKWSLELNTNVPAVGYDLASASYDNVSLSVNAQDAVPRGLTFNSDGTKVYIVGSGSDRIHQYNLSTAYDLSTASYINSFSVIGQDGTPFGVAFSNSGLKMYMLGFANGSIVYQYSLSTAFDVSTASYDTVSFSVAGQDVQSRGPVFNDNGTKMYTVGTASDSAHQYSLSTAYDLSTASYDSVSFSVAAQDTVPYGIAFGNNGSSLFISGDTNNTVYKYSLSTPYDLSTASYDNVSFSVGSQVSEPISMAFSGTGLKMYILDFSTDSIYQYTTASEGATPSLTWPPSIIWTENTLPVTSSDQNLILDFYTPDGGTTIYGIESINKDNTV